MCCVYKIGLADGFMLRKCRDEWPKNREVSTSSSVIALPETYGNLILFLEAVLPEMW